MPPSQKPSWKGRPHDLLPLTRHEGVRRDQEPYRVHTGADARLAGDELGHAPLLEVVGCPLVENTDRAPLACFADHTAGR
jgi:hypothetical protein